VYSIIQRTTGQLGGGGGSGTSSYGELRQGSLHEFVVQSLAVGALHEGSTVLDLGSGLAKVVAHLSQIGVPRHVIGVENERSRHLLAMSNFHALAAQGVNLTRTSLHLKDIMKMDYFNSVTFCYAFDPVFIPELHQWIAKMLKHPNSIVEYYATCCTKNQIDEYGFPFEENALFSIHTQMHGKYGTAHP
jgi:precorrin-6B methylase 2